MPKCNVCKENMNYYAHINKALVHFYFCPKMLDGTFKYFETEDNGRGIKHVYCRALNEEKQRLAIKQSGTKPRCWYCGEKAAIFTKLGGKVDLLYICPDTLEFMHYVFEHEMKQSRCKMEIRLYCRPVKR